MKDKIFKALKQEFYNLGLGDAVLTAYAESLDAAGVVTDENLDAVVKAQKRSLEAIQKANDKRATDAKKLAEEEAAKKAEEAKKAAEQEALKKAEEDAKKAAEEAAKKAGETAKKAGEGQEPDKMPDWFKAYQESQDKRMKEVIAHNDELKKTISSMQEENEKFKLEQKTAERNSFIASEAKRLGVPQWRTDEGFSIPAEADNKAITDYLTGVANNVKANMLPNGGNGFPQFDGKVEKSEIDSLVGRLMK